MLALDIDAEQLPRTEARLRGLGYDGQTLVVRRRNYAGLAARRGDYGEIATETVRPGYREIGGNPRAASAKMRWAMEC